MIYKKNLEYLWRFVCGLLHLPIPVEVDLVFTVVSLYLHTSLSLSSRKSRTSSSQAGRYCASRVIVQRRVAQLPPQIPNLKSKILASNRLAIARLSTLGRHGADRNLPTSLYLYRRLPILLRERSLPLACCRLRSSDWQELLLDRSENHLV